MTSGNRVAHHLDILLSLISTHVRRIDRVGSLIEVGRDVLQLSRDTSRYGMARCSVPASGGSDL